jgi:hypothetical protein
MIDESIKRLQTLCDTLPALLDKIEETDFSFKPSPERWSKKEILGHLIDSATNNHHRFVRVQFEHIPVISYDQNNWNKFGNYNNIDSRHLIAFWASYNRHLVELMQSIPRENLSKECNICRESNVSLQWLIDDYIRHLEHHLKQIIEYK